MLPAALLARGNVRAISASAPQKASGAHSHPLKWQAPYEVIALEVMFQHNSILSLAIYRL